MPGVPGVRPPKPERLLLDPLGMIVAVVFLSDFEEGDEGSVNCKLNRLFDHCGSSPPAS